MTLRIRFKPKFPARVSAGQGLSIVKTNGVYSFALNIGGLNATPSIAVGDRDIYFLHVYNSDTAVHSKFSIENLVAAIPAGGNVVGPASSINNRVATWNGTNGLLLKSSPVTIDDSGNATGFGTVDGGTHTITSTSASALAVGRQGATDPALKINAATASCVTGIEIIAAAAAGGVALRAISSGTNEALTIDAKGSGTITIGGTSTGSITLGRVVLGASGAVGAPGYAFTAHPTTGFYIAGVNTIGVACGGVQAMVFTAGLGTFTGSFLITQAQNAATELRSTNSSNGALASAQLSLMSDVNVSSVVRVHSSTYAGYKNQVANSFCFYTADAAGMHFLVDANGPITRGTNTGVRETLSGAGAFRWHAYGAGTLTTDASGNITAVSDATLKQVQGPYHRGLADLRKINPILYKWNELSGNEQEHTYAGFSAQDVQEAIPEAVFPDPQGRLGLTDRAIIAAAVNAIKELSEKVDRLS